MVSYTIGTFVLFILGSLTLWHLARLIPALRKGLLIILIILGAVTGIAMVIVKREAIAPLFLPWFILGLTAVLAWN